MRNTQYRIELSVHKPSVFNTIYTILSRVNCPNGLLSKLKLITKGVFKEKFKKEQCY